MGPQKKPRKRIVLATESGLRWRTIFQYASSPLLERDDDDKPLYMHRANCPNYCDYACNGIHGSKIAVDVAALEGREI